MKTLVFLLTGFFSFFLFDSQIHRRLRRGGMTSSFIERNLSKPREKTKKTVRKYKNSKFKKRKIFWQKSYHYQNSRLRGTRFSNQKSLRRMYRNS